MKGRGRGGSMEMDGGKRHGGKEKGRVGMKGEMD